MVTLLLRRARDRAKEKGLVYALDDSWLWPKVEKGICEATGLELHLEELVGDRTQPNPWAPSLDRINPRLGYTKRNTRLVCNVFNVARSNWGDEPLKIMLRALDRNKKQAAK